MKNGFSCARCVGGTSRDSISVELHGRQIQIAPADTATLPKELDRFFDFFCGGCNVGINVDCNETIFIDRDEHLIYLYQTFQHLDKEAIFEWIYDIIAEYGLSLVSRDGYEFYGCESSVGLGAYNRDAFNRLREDFNNCAVVDYRYYVMMYVIIVYAFNNQIRFNSAGEFNLPVGKRDFNSRIHSKLDAFIDRIHSTSCRFICSDFRRFDTSTLSESDFVYADPPYLITRATYNENDGWNERDERDLLNFLDFINARGIKFALSNVLSSKGKKNVVLSAWLERNAERYNVVHLKHSYANSNYHKSDKTSASDEVLVINYDVSKGGDAT